ncbi:MAG: PspC domain-containing protein, partial [Bacteroidales bacterium]|nr:PspC domain-containing protein [Bacteroidales bacterium]
MKTLRKSRTNRVFGGVCGGIAEYFNLDPVLIRLLFVLMAVFGGAGIFIYIIGLIIIPERSANDTVQDAEIVDDKGKTHASAPTDSMSEFKKEFDKVVEELEHEFKDTAKEVEREVDKGIKKRKSLSGGWFGIFLIFLGVAFLFKMFGWLHFSWYGIWKYWPIILIFVGISLVPMKRWLKNCLLFLSLTGLLIAMMCNSHSNRHCHSVNYRFNNYAVNNYE